MLAKIKNLEEGVTKDTTYMFLRAMYKEGIFEFFPIETAVPLDWEGWWQIYGDEQLNGFVYHISWLEPVE